MSKYTKEMLAPLVASATSFASLLRQLGFESYSGSTAALIRKRVEDFGLSIDHFKVYSSLGRKHHQQTLDSVFRAGHTSRVQANILRKFLLLAGVPYLCSACGQGEVWQGQPLVLDVDHINGDWSDNRLTNLRVLCPNCHRQTPTFGRKSKGEPKKPRKLTRVLCKVCPNTFETPLTTLSKKKFCSRACRKAGTEVAKWPKDLASRVWQIPSTTLAKELGVSSSAIKKRCVSLGIPTPPRGYWQKINAS